jgi:hypothetical protein
MVGGRLRQKVLSDPGLTVWKDLGLDVWPTVAICVPGFQKVMFVGKEGRLATRSEAGLRWALCGA